MEVRTTTTQRLTDTLGRESFACVSSAWQAHEGELLGYLRHRLAHGVLAAGLALLLLLAVGVVRDPPALAMLSLTLLEMQEAQFEMPPRSPRPLFGPVETSDGYINIAVASERTFDGLAKAAGRIDWFDDPRFKSYPDRRANWDKLMDEFEDWSRTVSNSDCLAILADHGVPAAAYRTVREAMADPQLAHRQAFATVADAGGTFQALNPPFRMSGTATATGPKVSSLGQDTLEVLRAAGLSDTEIQTAIG